MSPQERDKRIYRLAKQFLRERCAKLLKSPKELEKYLKPARRPKTLAGVYQHILQSARNADRKAGVIPEPISYLGPALCRFNPKAVCKKYAGDAKEARKHVLNHIGKRPELSGRPRGKRSILALYSQTILDGARFLHQFRSASEFYQWVGFFNKDERARPALPFLIHAQVKGLGFALASDFLKELGYTRFAKPDRQIRYIFSRLNLCDRPESDSELAKAVERVARNAGVSAYNADKVFWLIGSGKFYKHKHVGRNGKVGSFKRAFIAHVKRELR